MSKSKNGKAEKLRAISKCISEMVLPERAQSLSLQKAGHYIEDALNLGAFNRPEHTSLRTEIKVLLSQPKEEMEPHISAWAGIVSQLKPKKSQFPSVDIVKDFPSDRELVAKAILEEAEAIEQADLASKKQNGKTTEKWYHNRTIQAALISAAVLILLTAIGWYLNSNNKRSVPIQQSEPNNEGGLTYPTPKPMTSNGN